MAPLSTGNTGEGPLVGAWMGYMEAAVLALAVMVTAVVVVSSVIEAVHARRPIRYWLTM